MGAALKRSLRAPGGRANDRAVSLGRKRDNQFATRICWLFIIVAVGRIAEIIPALASIPLAKIIGVLWLFSVLSQKPEAAEPRILRLPIVRTSLALLVLADISLLYSVWPGPSLQFVYTSGLVLPVAMVLMLSTLRSWPTIRGTLGSFVFSGATFAALVLWQSKGGRETAGNQDPNDLAYLLVTVLPIAIAFTVSSRGLRRVVHACIVVALTETVLLTQSRGGFLALSAVVLTLTLFPLTVRLSDVGRSRAVRTIVGRVAILTLVAAITWFALPNDARVRLATVINISADYNVDQHEGKGRAIVWKRNLIALASRPIGFGVQASPMVDLQAGGVFMGMHNSVVQVAVELGVVGLVLYLRVYWLAAQILRRQLSAPHSSENVQERLIFCRALVVSLIGNFVAGFFLTQAYSNTFWLLVAAIAAISRTFDPAFARPAPSSGAARHVAP